LERHFTFMHLAHFFQNAAQLNTFPKLFLVHKFSTTLLGAELREIQKQIDNLPHSTDPHQVSEFMALRRDVMFLELDTAVRHCMADTFLSTGNVQAYKVWCRLTR
jgi:hypothetical protein